MLALLPRDVATSSNLRVAGHDELCQAKSLDHVNDHDIESWTTVESCKLFDIQDQLLVDPHTEWISDTQGQIDERFWHRQHAQNLGSRHWGLWIRGSRELLEFLGHHVGLFNGWDFSKKAHGSSFLQNCAQ